MTIDEVLETSASFRDYEIVETREAMLIHLRKRVVGILLPEGLSAERVRASFSVPRDLQKTYKTAVLRRVSLGRIL